MWRFINLLSSDLTETAGLRASPADGGGETHAHRWGVSRAHQTAPVQSWGESTEEDPQKDQEQGQTSASQNCKKRHTSNLSTKINIKHTYEFQISAQESRRKKKEYMDTLEKK